MTIRSIAITLLLFVAEKGAVAESASNPSPKFLGSPSCSSTSCHGGADEKKNQNLIWSKLDYHSRSYATLTSARSERFADVLKLGDPTKSSRCTSCHAPLAAIEEQNRLSTAKPIHGVSCENCHGPAENWLRSHTRPDFTYEDRVAAGLRDLKSLYVRANTCVACHQTLDPALAAAGHPELMFELDGQSVSEPKHWKEADDGAGPKSWLIGQTVALREMSWQLSRVPKRDENLVARWGALSWLLQQLADVDSQLAEFKSLPTKAEGADFENAQKISDAMARRIDTIAWSSDLTRKCLAKLRQTSAAFQDQNISSQVQARRAERLVLAVDRLSVRLDAQRNKGLETAVNRLFKLAQSIPDFEPQTFAKALSALPSL